jgi:hypothetical protein
LGVEPESPAFPAVVTCPLCQQNALHLFDDIPTDGIWLHCNSCSAHGDIITFGAAIWNTSLPATLTRFVDLGLIHAGEADKAAGDYERTTARVRDAENFWLESESQVWNHDDDIIACRLRELGVLHEINARGIVGVAHHDQVSALCAALGRATPTKLRTHGTSLVFPYYDLPGRITGLQLVQYSEEFESKATFVPVSGYKRRRPEAGYFLLSALMQPPSPLLKNNQFIVDDPVWALTMQCEQLKRGLPFLPFAVSYTGPEANSYGFSWQAFPPLTRIFQSHIASPELISRACMAKGYACVLPADKRLNRILEREKTVISRLVKMRSTAQTWQTAALDTMSQMNEIAAHSFATRLTIPHEKLTAFLHKIEGKFSPGFAGRVLTSAAQAPSAPTRTHRRWIVTARDDGWWNHVGNRVCSANVIINRVIHADDDKIYSGIIRVDGEKIPFSDTAAKIESMGLLAYAYTVAAPHKKLIVFDRAWNKRSHIISIEINKPEFINASNRLGWDEPADTFRFANFEITNVGAVVSTDLALNKKKHGAFPEPTTIAPPAIRQFLTPSHENAFIWSVFSAVAANLINPILRRENVATGIPGPNFIVAARLGAALGCPHHQCAAMARNHVSKQISDTTHDLDWPLFTSSTFDDASYGSVIPKCHNRPVLARLAPAAAAAATGYGWQLITGAAPAVTDFSAFRYVLPAYIQHVLRNRMSLTLKDKNTARAVLTDVHDWLQKTYETSFQLGCANNQLLTQTQAHTALLQELNNALQAGKLDILPRPRRRDQPGNYLLRRKEHWWLNQRAIDRYFYSCKTVAPNWLAVIDLMTVAGVYAGEEQVHNMPGILVDAQWCDSFWTANNDYAREIG